MEVNMTTPPPHDEDDDGWDWDEVYKSISIMSAVIYSLVFVLGVLGNGVVIWATGFRMKKTVSTVWYLNLAVADFLVTAFLPLKITESATLDRIWHFEWFMCKMDGLVFFMNMYASIYTLVLISVDRCVGVVCPVWTRNHRTVRKASWVSLGVWVMALALSIPHVIFKNTGFRCVDDYAFTIIGTNFVLGFVVPFAVIVSCYSIIMYRIRINRSLAGQSGRSFKIIATVIATFFLCWIPYHIIRLMEVHVRYNIDRGIEVSETLKLVNRFGLPITLTLALLNSCLNPLMYVFSQGFKDVFLCRSILKVLEKVFAEDPPQTNNTSTDPAVTRMMTRRPQPKTRTPNRGPPATQDPNP